MKCKVGLAVFACLVLCALPWQGSARGQAKPSYDFGAAARGENAFKAYCHACHGKAGKGDGPLAKDLKVPPADLTQIAFRNQGDFSPDQVARRIDGREPVKGHGSKDMPAWGEAFQITDGSEGAKEKIKDLTHYLWSIQTEVK